MCAVAAAALELWAASAASQTRGDGGDGGSRRRVGRRQPLSRDEALRAAFRQVYSACRLAKKIVVFVAGDLLLRASFEVVEAKRHTYLYIV